MDQHWPHNPSGHPPTFESVFVAEYPAMVALAAAVMGRRDQAEDVASEAMSRLNAHWGKVGSYDKPGAWLRRVTINLALSRRRRLVRELRTRARLAQTTSPATMAPAPSAHQAIWDAVASLPKQQRAAIALHYLEERTIDEIAETLQIAPATARVHLHRARQTLRTTIDQEVAS